MKNNTANIITVIIALCLCAVFFIITNDNKTTDQMKALELQKAEMSLAQYKTLTPLLTFAAGCVVVFGAVALSLILLALAMLVWRKVILIKPEGGLFPLVGVIDPNRRVPKNASAQQMATIGAAMHIQALNAGADDPHAITTTEDPRRMPSLRVIDDSQREQKMLSLFQDR